VRLGVAARLSGSDGGGYQYSLAVLHAMEDWARCSDHADELVLITNDTSHPVAANLGRKGWTVVAMPAGARRVAGLGMAGRLARRVVGDQFAWAIYRRLRSIDLNDGAVRPSARRFLRSLGVDMMLYTSATPLSFWGGVPYVMAIHDLQHRVNPRFEEVGANGQWEGRERLYRNGTRSAVRVLADSEVGREDILKFYGPYGVTGDMVKVLPYVCPPYLKTADANQVQEVRTKYGLPDAYLFYPAQFWPHKNHLRIVEALGLIQRRLALTIPIVLCGSHSGRLRNQVFRQVAARARRLGIPEAMHYIGYTSDDDMAALYSGARALIMPTFFGPTNIPVLEAWQCGCPVITSDIRGIREQTGDAGVLVDPESTESIAAGIIQLWTSEDLRASLIVRGRKRLAEYTDADFRNRLETILDEARTRVLSSRPGGGTS
jgi:glycosyltransferase involved in cell wall biosynthesis